MKETIDRYEGFLFEFQKQNQHLIDHANLGYSFEFSEDDEKVKLKVYVRHLHKFSIEILNKYFNDKYIINTGILEHRDKICINIY